MEFVSVNGTYALELVQVVDAMRQTVTNMLGTLPPQFFDIHVSTVKRTLCPFLICYYVEFHKLFTCELSNQWM